MFFGFPSRALLSFVLAIGLMAIGQRSSAATVFQTAGADAAAVQSTVDDYRAALGTNNGAASLQFSSGRREINWDGLPDNVASPNDMPFTQFINRGALFATPGTAVRVSADADNPTSTPVRFSDINPTYSSIFQTFSAERLFSPIGSNIVDLTFVVPGSTAPALSTGFGAIYCDADIAGATSFQYFDINGGSLGTFEVPTFNNGLSFLGVVFDSPIVHRVRIAYGNVALGPNDGGAIDVAVMDDFIYGEPQATTAAIPLPSAILAFGLTAPLAIVARRRICRS
jgi:hypothetical protein